MRSIPLFATGLLATVLLAAQPCFSQLPGDDPDSTSAPAATFRQAVDETADSLLREKTAFFVPPVFLVKDDDVLQYRLGGFLPAALGQDAADVFNLAVCTHAHAVALTEVFSTAPVPESVWSPSVRELREVEDDLISLGYSRLDESALQAVDLRLERTLATLATAIEDHARAQDWLIQRDEIDLEGLFKSAGLDITLKTLPAGGKIRLLKLLSYRKEVHMGKADEDLSWESILSPEAKLMGRFRYWVTWPDSRETRGTVDIVAATTLEFTPD